MGQPPLDGRHARQLLTFARWHTLALDLPDDLRLSIEATCRRLAAGGTDAAERDELLDQLDDYLVTEIALRHQ